MFTPVASERTNGDYSTDVLAASHRCHRCTYDLVGLPLGGKCPECGTEIAESVRSGLLVDSSREYVRAIAGGILCLQFSALAGIVVFGLMAVGIVFAIMSGIAELLERFLASPRATGNSSVSIEALLAVGLVVMAALSVASCFGSFLFTTRDSDGVETRSSARDRIIVRVIASVQCAVNLLVLSTPILGESALESLGGFFVYLMALSLLLQPVQVIAATSRAGWLFSRTQSSRGAARARTYVVLLPVLMILGSIVLIGPLVAMFMHFRLLSRLRYELESVLDRRDEPTTDRATRPASPSRVDFRPPMEQDRTP